MTRLHRLILAMAPTDHTGAPMATTNPTVTGAWTLPVASQTLYVAVGAVDDSDSDSDPEAPPTDLLGHALAPGQIGDPGGDVGVVALDLCSQSVLARTSLVRSDIIRSITPPPSNLAPLWRVIRRFRHRDGINRALLGPGPVFAKCVDPTASVPVALTAWTPA